MATVAEIKNFGIEELCEFLGSSGEISEDGIANFRTNRINGFTFFELNDTDLKELLPLLGDRKLIQRLITSYQPTISYNI